MLLSKLGFVLDPKTLLAIRCSLVVKAFMISTARYTLAVLELFACFSLSSVNWSSVRRGTLGAVSTWAPTTFSRVEILPPSWQTAWRTAIFCFISFYSFIINCWLGRTNVRVLRTFVWNSHPVSWGMLGWRGKGGHKTNHKTPDNLLLSENPRESVYSYWGYSYWSACGL